jgi:hypothetical protein
LGEARRGDRQGGRGRRDRDRAGAPRRWGELATHSAVQRKLAGVVIHGAIRDTPEIRRLGFPAFARVITARAGEPKGFGEIGVPIEIEGIRIEPNDWIVGDDDGVIVLPQRFAVEIANRAMDRLELITACGRRSSGSTFGKVADLYKWGEEMKRGRGETSGSAQRRGDRREARRSRPQGPRPFADRRRAQLGDRAADPTTHPGREGDVIEVVSLVGGG